MKYFKINAVNFHYNLIIVNNYYTLNYYTCSISYNTIKTRLLQKKTYLYYITIQYYSLNKINLLTLMLPQLLLK